jgi:DNA-binding NtrC family response regulator
MKNATTAKIFIVEDEPFFAHLINYDLEANYYDGIRVFFSGEECLKNLELRPKVVILDQQLPGISGLEVLKKIKTFDPKIHVIFLSGQSGAQIAIGAFKQGALDFIMKGENAFQDVRELLKKIFKHPERPKSANGKVTSGAGAKPVVNKKNLAGNGTSEKKPVKSAAGIVKKPTGIAKSAIKNKA